MTVSQPTLVTIIVPVYNVERYLDCCLDSIRAQTYAHLEIIVVEDCSTDDSLARLQPHLADPRVRLIRHERNGGLSAARNTGIEVASGDYVLFVDSDDAIAPTLVEACIARAQASGADVVVFDFSAFQDGSELPNLGGPAGDAGARELERVEYLKLPHFAWLKFIRADLLRDSRLRFPVGYYYEDWPFHWELGFLAPRIDYLPLIGLAYRLRAGSITGSKGEKLLHIFRAQHLVAGVVSTHGGGVEIDREVMRKACSGSWFVLVNVERQLIGRALQLWSVYLENHPVKWPSKAPKDQLTRMLGKVPASVGVVCVNSIRTVLQLRRSRRARHSAAGEV